MRHSVVVRIVNTRKDWLIIYQVSHRFTVIAG
jgi:hypothetical protein